MIAMSSLPLRASRCLRRRQDKSKRCAIHRVVTKSIWIKALHAQPLSKKCPRTSCGQLPKHRANHRCDLSSRSCIKMEMVSASPFSQSNFHIDLPAALIERVKGGDATAFEAIYRRFERPVYTLALRVLGQPDAARDALHDAMLKAFQRIAQFRGDAPFWAWLRQIAMNEALMRLRSGERFVVSMESAGIDDDTLADDAPAPWAHADASALEHALAQLPAVTRSVLWLYHVEGFTHPEIAAAMCKSTSFSKSQLARGTTRLRRLLDPELETVPCLAPTA